MVRAVVVWGAGYARLVAAKRLARQVYAEEVPISLVSAGPDFVERQRLHQVAAGQASAATAAVDMAGWHPGPTSLTNVLDQFGVDVRADHRITSVRPSALTTDHGGTRLPGVAVGAGERARSHCVRAGLGRLDAGIDQPPGGVRDRGRRGGRRLG
jgi:NADH:ubiquinone reductase (H+-translocating)